MKQSGVQGWTRAGARGLAALVLALGLGAAPALAGPAHGDVVVSATVAVANAASIGSTAGAASSLHQAAPAAYATGLLLTEKGSDGDGDTDKQDTDPAPERPTLNTDRGLVFGAIGVGVVILLFGIRQFLARRMNG